MNQSIVIPGYMGFARLAARPDAKVSDAKLVISPPLEPLVMLKLQRWLFETAGAHTVRLTLSNSADTVHVMTFERPIPLLRMLAALPFVAEVTAEPPGNGNNGLAGLRRSCRGTESDKRNRVGQ